MNRQDCYEWLDAEYSKERLRNQALEAENERLKADITKWCNGPCGVDPMEGCESKSGETCHLYGHTDTPEESTPDRHYSLINLTARVEAMEEHKDTIVPAAQAMLDRINAIEKRHNVIDLAIRKGDES